MNSWKTLNKLKTDSDEIIIKVALQQMLQVRKAVQNTAEAQLKQQEDVIHNHLHWAFNAVKAEAQTMWV